MRLVIAAALGLMLAGPAAARTTIQAPAPVEDTSSVEANGHRVIQQSVVVPASASEVWSALTTSEGWRRLGVGFAQVDFRIGGVIETGYDPGSTLGARNNIRNQIVAYVPGRMLAIRNIQAPSGFQHAAEYGLTATAIELQPLGGDHTRVTITATGFAPGPAYDALYAFFRRGNGYTLELLRDSFAAE